MPTLAGGAEPARPAIWRRLEGCVQRSKSSTFRRKPEAHAGTDRGITLMAEATLTIASKNYGSWSLRGWLLCKLAGLDFEEEQSRSDDPSVRAELLLLSPSFLVPA